jgi:hypothetical protein
LRFRAV